MSSIILTYAHNSRAVNDPFALAFDWLQRQFVGLEELMDVLRTTSLGADFVVDILRRQLEQGASVTSHEPLARSRLSDVPYLVPSDDGVAMQRIKNQAAIRLIQKWLADDSGYDEATWPRVKEAIEENRLSDRSRFDD